MINGHLGSPMTRRKFITRVGGAVSLCFLPVVARAQKHWG
jgi:hypothetical protein